MKPEKRGWACLSRQQPWTVLQDHLGLLLDVVVTRMPPVRSCIV
jgi:hypothetical protein